MTEEQPGYYAGPPAQHGPYQAEPPVYPEPTYPYAQPQYGEPQYGEPQYGQLQYGQPQQQWPQQQQWGQPYPYPPGYPYAPVAPGDRRPGTLTAAAVLGFVAAGMLIFAAIFLFLGSSLIHDLENDLGRSHASLATEFIIDGILNLIGAGLLIAGGVSMLGRSQQGRLMYAIGSVLVVAQSVYWIARWHDTDSSDGFLFWALVYAALVIVGVCLAFAGGVNRWFSPPRSAA